MYYYNNYLFFNKKTKKSKQQQQLRNRSNNTRTSTFPFVILLLALFIILRIDLFCIIMCPIRTLSNNKEEDKIQKIREFVRLAKENISDDVPLNEIIKLDLSGRGLTNLPDGIDIYLPNLSILFLSNNNFIELPAIVGKCKKLQMIAFKSNQMKTIHPDSLQSQLRWLILTDNQLTNIPDTIGRCIKLQKFMLSGNQLTKLPETIANCTNLELIRLASNQLIEPPLTVLKIKSLRWVALADNPFINNVKQQEIQTTNIIHDLCNEENGIVLGQGAGGITRKVDYNGTYVAVKQYGGSMTSDGLPETERKISVAASNLNSNALIKVYGECNNSGSLVMEFLDNYTALAGPPNFNTCSRDDYSDNKSPCVKSLTWNEASNLITILLDALVSLHNIGIHHGDFYGHNILIQKNNFLNVRLSDFGAAFFYDINSEYGKLLEIIELRSYSILVDEVMNILLKDNNETNNNNKQRLQSLIDMCQKDNITMEAVHIWWKQQLLSDLAKAFDDTEVTITTMDHHHHHHHHIANHNNHHVVHHVEAENHEHLPTFNVPHRSD